MKIIVVSDSHGSSYELKRILDMHKNADVVVHCGDSRGEMENLKMIYKDKMYFEVKGNCDLGSTLPTTLTFDLDGIRFFVTHGHLYNAKLTLYNLVCAARENSANVLLFGHTHQSLCDYDDGLYIINPGSCSGYNATFAIIETHNGKILPNILSLN